MEKTLNKLHQNLGKLFYAIAMADKKINHEEITALKAVVGREWYDLDSKPNGFVIDGHQEILEVFNHLHSRKAESDSCFIEFREFFNEHQNLFNEDLRKFIWDTAQAIASSFAQKNKSEVILLAKLKMLLES
ncbi:MAG: hypothetical protein GY931_16615 [Maribacter sp.]|nr:hypothetical protein [Maribacter sp.]